MIGSLVSVNIVSFINHNIGMATIPELVALVKTAAERAANFQERFAAEDIEARKIVDVMEAFLKSRGRVVYGGAAINAYLSPETRFYDPKLHLPDYDFLTPDPLQDTADLIAQFKREGFQEVEAKFGIHEGTYKVFVNFRAAADITYMPTDLYTNTLKESTLINGIRCASPDFLRMNIYVELSRPQGNISRWEKVYQRLLLLNHEHPMVAKCTENQPHKNKNKKIVELAKEYGAIFLTEPDDSPLILMTDNHKLETALEMTSKKFESIGDILPARVEFYKGTRLIVVVFDTMACHAYVTIESMRIGSLDLLIHMYYAMYFTNVNYISDLPCVIHRLIKLEAERRQNAVKGDDTYDVFPIECVGHQPTMPELKRAHRKRVREKRKELAHLFQRSSNRKNALT